MPASGTSKPATARPRAFRAGATTSCKAISPATFRCATASSSLWRVPRRPTAKATPQGASTPTASSPRATAASRPAFKFPPAKACGRHSGCCRPIRPTVPGQPAAKSTSWRCSRASRNPSPKARHTTAWLGRTTSTARNAIPASIRRTASTFMPWNGMKTNCAGSRTAFTSTPCRVPPIGRATRIPSPTPINTAGIPLPSISRSTYC